MKVSTDLLSRSVNSLILRGVVDDLSCHAPGVVPDENITRDHLNFLPGDFTGETISDDDSSLTPRSERSPFFGCLRNSIVDFYSDDIEDDRISDDDNNSDDDDDVTSDDNEESPSSEHIISHVKKKISSASSSSAGPVTKVKKVVGRFGGGGGDSSISSTGIDVGDDDERLTTFRRVRTVRLKRGKTYPNERLKGERHGWDYGRFCFAV